MLALKINDIKTFMNQLLIRDTFDFFSLVEASITTFNHFTVDGALHMDFFDTDTRTSLQEKGLVYSSWKDVKAYCYSIIRGKLPPVQFRFVFQLTPSQLSLITSDAYTLSEDLSRGLVLNLQYKNSELLCTTGISFRTFTMDKTPENRWDTVITDFLCSHQIDFDRL